MPTTRHTTLLLLATFALAETACGQGTSTGSVDIGGLGRMRPGVSSVGPRSAARKTDHLVEPASFQAAVTPKPLRAPSGVQELHQADIDTDRRVRCSEAESHQPGLDREAPSPSDGDADGAISSHPTKLTTTTNPGRRLGSATDEAVTEQRPSSPLRNPLEGLLAWRPSSQQLTATGAGLAIAVGLLLSTIWLIRSLAPKSSRPLPRDVVEVLGRAPLGAKQTTQLVRVGSKLVLVAVTPDGAKTLTEVTDPGEVQRLIAACESNSGRGSAADFDAMLQQMSSEPAERGFLGTTDRRDDAGPYGYAEAAFDPRSLAAAYANTPGGRGDG